MRILPVLLFSLTGLLTAGCSNTCEPAGGRAYCEGDIVKACVEEDGKGVMQETDCAASGEVCASNAHLNTSVALCSIPAVVPRWSRLRQLILRRGRRSTNR